MVSGHSGWSFWKASAMAERSASTQTVILAVGSCATVGKPYVLPVEEPADSAGPLLGVPEPADSAGTLLRVPRLADHVAAMLGDGAAQPGATRALQAEAAGIAIN